MTAAIVVALLLQLGATPDAVRQRAWEKARPLLPSERVVKHSLAVEGAMREMARQLRGNEDEWGLAGLLHDIDIAQMPADYKDHGVIGARMLEEMGMSPAVVYAVKSHDDRSGFPRKTVMDRALYCADQAYWFVLSPQRKKSVEEKLSKECPVPLPRVLEITQNQLR